MQLKLVPNGSRYGNCIAFLIGATFNMAAHVLLPCPTEVIIDAISGGIYCLMLKLIFDLIAMFFRHFGISVWRWLENKIE